MKKMLVLSLIIAACSKDQAPLAPVLLGDPSGEAAMDPALQACAAAHLGLSPDATFSQDDAMSLKHLDCIDEGVTSLNGIEIFSALETLSVWENDIDDVSSLQDLTALKWLELGNNAITDISALAELSELTRFGASSNAIEDIDVVAGFSQLEWLNLDDNKITNVNAITGLSALRWLTIDHNNIDDAEALLALTDTGADVYHDHQSASEAPRPPAPGISGSLDTAIGTLSPRLNNDNALVFDLLIGGNAYPVRSEFSGALRQENGQLILERDGRRVVVGHTDGATASLCEDGEPCTIAIGLKMGPASAYDGLAPEPVVSLALGLHAKPGTDQATYGEADMHLVDYAIASPNQFDAGSCLFMTNTGAMELLINQHTGLDELAYNGDSDLSERFLMAAYQDVPSSTIRYWLTDTIYTFNHFNGAMLNRDYPFTAGYVRETSAGIRPCEASDDGAYFSCSVNWFDQRPEGWRDMLVETPEVERTVAYIDPERSSSSQWNVGLMDEDDVEKIKYMLRTRRAPVIVVYNHYLYWHADMVVGYDDTVATDGCPMVESSMDYFDEEGAGGYTQKIERHIEEIGDCTNQGIFYVRDSIYEGGSEEELYEYAAGFSEKYSKRIIERSYNWVKYLGNHAYSIHRK
jgi:hypothetical protein